MRDVRENLVTNCTACSPGRQDAVGHRRPPWATLPPSGAPSPPHPGWARPPGSEPPKASWSRSPAPPPPVTQSGEGMRWGKGPDVYQSPPASTWSLCPVPCPVSQALHLQGWSHRLCPGYCGPARPGQPAAQSGKPRPVMQGWAHPGALPPCPPSSSPACCSPSPRGHLPPATPTPASSPQPTPPLPQLTLAVAWIPPSRALTQGTAPHSPRQARSLRVTADEALPTRVYIPSVPVPSRDPRTVRATTLRTEKLHSKERLRGMKRQPIEWEQIFVIRS